MIEVLDDFIRGIRDLSDATAIRDQCQVKLNDLGLDKFAFTSLNVPEFDGKNYFLSNYPVEYMTRYMRKQYRFVDPILVKSTTSFLPFTWDITAFIAEDDTQRDMFKVAMDFNIARGITVPIHNPGLRHSSLHVTADIPAKDLSHMAQELENNLILIGIFLNATVSEKILARDVSPTIKLTAREKECLLWTARGKTTWDISQILNIAESTVLTHITKSMAKLGVHNRPHAVVKTIMMGLIVP